MLPHPILSPPSRTITNPYLPPQQNQFYINLEGTGVLPPDQIFHAGIKVLQQKLATLIQELSGVDPHLSNGHNMQHTGGQSPDMLDMANGGPPGGMGTAYGGNTAYGGVGDGGYTTPYGAGAGGATGAWGGGPGAGAGGTTPYGATPYGRSGNW